MRKSPPPQLSGPAGSEGATAASRRASGTGQRTTRRPHWRTLTLFSLVVLATYGWSGCGRVSSGVDTGPSLTPEELPLRGETMLPDIGRPLPDIRITPQGDHRGKSGMAQASDNQPGLHIGEVALRAYIEAMADIFQEPHLSLFIVADSTGEFYSYGYRIIDFHPVEQELSGGQRELYIYVHPNEAGDGLYRMNVGLIPRTQSAFEDYQRWLLPEYVGLERVDPMQSDLGKNKLGQVISQDGEARLECFWETCTNVGFWLMDDGWSATQWAYPCQKCYYVAATGPGTPPSVGPSGGHSCWETDSCRPNTGGGGRDGLDRTGCDGDPAASRDHCGRCVGGDTGRSAADAGADCATYAPCDLRISELKAAFPSVSEQNLSKIQKLIDKHGHAFGLNSTERVAHFLSQVAHESGGLGSLTQTENLNYSTAERLVAVWPRWFSLTDHTKTDPTPFVQNPEKLANFIYGNRGQGSLGNRGISSGDGWRYRGRGLIQLTGRYNYQQFDAFYRQHFGGNYNLVNNPELLETNDELSIIASMWFFKTRVIDRLSNLNVEDVTQLINGGDNGIEDRRAKFNNAMEEIVC